jgi:hypothetical protein
MPCRRREELKYSSTIIELGTRRKWSASRPGLFIPGEMTPGNQWIGGRMGLRPDLENMEK